MLQFFRRHQKFFFLFITIVIVVTFSLFGTYQAFAPSTGERSEEEGSYVSQMARFLDTEQWMVSRQFFATNFLNDGVLSKEFLETGMADLVMEAYPEQFQIDPTHLEREKNYLPYKHPYLPALSAEAIWSVFAPEIPIKLLALQNGKGSFKDRKELFLAQKNFPAAFLSQVIRYQEQSNPTAPIDPRLRKEDVALFGYQNISDWFGEAFVEALAEKIIQTANLARKLGYRASKDELLAELVARSQETYQGLKGKMDLPIESGYELFQVYLRQTGLSAQKALKIWEDVTLFRKLMHEVGAAAFTDSLPLSQFYAFAYENATVELYQMASGCKLQSLEELKKLEVYLDAVGKKSAPLDIPSEYLPLSTIEANAPELVGKRYELSFAHVSKKALQAKVSVKETIQWECDPKNWKQIQKQFPELAQKKGSPYEILEGMDQKGKKLIDVYARKQIVDAHPEWIEEALKGAALEEKQLFLSSGTQKPFEGIENVSHFGAALEAQNEHIGYTQDGYHYYRFVVEKKSEAKEILTYKEALKEGILDKLILSKEGDEMVQKIVDVCPSAHKNVPHAYRFAKFIAQYKEVPPQGALAKQFQIEKKEKTVTRSESSFISLDEVLALEVGAISDIKIDAVEGAYFYKFLDKRIDTTLPLDKMVQTQEMLSKEARCRYFEKCLKNSFL